MPRFADARKTLFKRTDDMLRQCQLDHERPRQTATPRLLSPFKPDGIKARDEVEREEILHPTYNRARRRAVGQTRGAGHGKRFRRLQRLVKGPRIQELMARTSNTIEGN